MDHIPNSSSVPTSAGSSHSIEQLSLDASSANTTNTFMSAAMDSAASGRTRGRPSLLGSLFRRLSPRFKRRAKSASPARFLDEPDEEAAVVGEQQPNSGKKGGTFFKLLKSARLSRRHRRSKSEFLCIYFACSNIRGLFKKYSTFFSQTAFNQITHAKRGRTHTFMRNCGKFQADCANQSFSVVFIEVA